MAKKAKKTAKKATSKKRTTAKAAAKKTTGKKTTPTATAKRVVRELNVRTSGFDRVEKIRTKGQVYKELQTSTGMSRKEITNFFENLSALMHNDLTKGSGTFQVPGLLKVTVVRKPAVPARKGINPFTGQETMFKAKPARNVVKARPLKGLKDMVK